MLRHIAFAFVFELFIVIFLSPIITGWCLRVSSKGIVACHTSGVHVSPSETRNTDTYSKPYSLAHTFRTDEHSTVSNQ